MLDICKHLIWCSRKRLAGCIKEKQGKNAEGPVGGRVANQILVRDASLILEGGARRDILWLQLKVD